MLAALMLVLAANPALDDARALYDQFKFKEALRKLDWASSRLSPEDRVDFEVLSGLCRLNLNQAEMAKEHFRSALKIDAAIELPRSVTPKARELFAALKAEREKELAAMPRAKAPDPEPARVEPSRLQPEVSDAPAPAAPAAVTPVIVAPPPSRSYVAPIAALSGAVVAGVAGLVLSVLWPQEMARAQAEPYEADAFARYRSAQTLAVAGYAALGVAAAAGVLAVLLFAFGG